MNDYSTKPSNNNTSIDRLSQKNSLNCNFSRMGDSLSRNRLNQSFYKNDEIMQQQGAETKENKTGLPDNLKAGIEHLSGLTLDDVKVHYHSDKPAQLQARAYAQGTDIHLASGQEKHLPHEAWHVVQQKQGRVRPTITESNGSQINEDIHLEREADVMGNKALNQDQAPLNPVTQSGLSPSSIAPIQCLRAVNFSRKTPHAHVGNAQISNQLPVDAANQGDRPIIIELMEHDANSAIAKIDALSASANGTDNRAIMVGLNQKAQNQHVNNQSQIKNNTDINGYNNLIQDVQRVAARAENNNIQGGCFPAIWSSTSAGGGYTFPFLEMRAHVTLHEGTQDLIRSMKEATGMNPVMRSMDADVSNDPLLATPLSAMGEETKKAIYDLGRGRFEEREYPGQHGPTETYGYIGDKGTNVVSGGYAWDTSNKDQTFWGDGYNANGPQWNTKLANCLEILNNAEHTIRIRYNDALSSTVYWPEPNMYMDAEARTTGAEKAMAKGESLGSSAQQRESTFYLKDIPGFVGNYNPDLVTTKPLKTYFNGLRDMIKNSNRTSYEDVKALVESVRQTHLSPEHLKHIAMWHSIGAISKDVISLLETYRSNILHSVVTSIYRELNRQ